MIIDGQSDKEFNITSPLLIVPHTNNADLKHNMDTIKKGDIAYVYQTSLKKYVSSQIPDINRKPTEKHFNLR